MAGNRRMIRRGVGSISGNYRVGGRYLWAIEGLVKAGADIYLKDSEGQTALDIARRFRQTGAVTELIKIREAGKNAV